MAIIKNLEGLRFGRILVLKENPVRTKSRQVRWDCLCDCGEYKTIISSSLVQGKTTSCGCLSREMLSERNTKHLLTDTQEYWVLAGMKDRCFNPNHSSFNSYGGRGIIVCERWLGGDGVGKFIEDMGKRPSDKHTIERVDVNGNYCKENCIWTDNSSLQAYNIRLKKNNTSGRTGVHSKDGKWRVYISYNKRRENLGSFDSFESACKAREAAELKYYGFNKE